MRDVLNGQSRHVAGDAVLALPSRLSHGRRQGGAPPFVALQATVAVVGDLRGRCGQAVRVVARDATKLSLALAETATRFDLLHLPDRLKRVAVSRIPFEDRPEPVEREARAEVEGLMAGPGRAKRPLEMTLLTDRIPQRWGQIGRVDDGQVGLGRRPILIHVQCAWAVAALTPDCVTLEDRQLIAVQRPGHGANPVGVAEQTVGMDRARSSGAVCYPRSQGRSPSATAAQTKRSETGTGSRLARSGS